MGAYVALASMDFSFNTLTEGGRGVFSLALCHIQKLYPDTYAQDSISTLAPLGPHYEFDTKMEAMMHIFFINA